MDVELAPPPGFVIVERQAGCAFALGATEVDGVVPSWATCRWPEVPASAVARVLDDPGGQDAVWSRVMDSQVVGGSAGDWLVWQRHDVEIVADREVVVRWTRHDSPAGSSWSWRSVEAPLPRQSGNVPCSRWDGSWTLSAASGGGSVVTFENHYQPGSFPSELVRLFLLDELRSTLSQLKAAALS